MTLKTLEILAAMAVGGLCMFVVTVAFDALKLWHSTEWKDVGDDHERN